MVFHLCVRKPPLVTQSGAGGEVRAELPHYGSVAQALLRPLHGAVVFLHVFCKWSEGGFSWGAVFELGLAKLQLPLAKSADEALGVQGFGVASNSERQTQADRRQKVAKGRQRWHASIGKIIEAKPSGQRFVIWLLKSVLTPGDFLDSFFGKIFFNYQNLVLSLQRTKTEHWLPVSFHLHSRCWLSAIKTRRALGPGYLKAHLSPCVSPCPLRTAEVGLLQVPSGKQRHLVGTVKRDALWNDAPTQKNLF